MVETSAIGGVTAQTNANFGQQKKIEGAERSITRQANQNTTNATVARNNNTGNKLKAAPEQATPKTEVDAAGPQNNVQHQAKNLNAANDVSGTSLNQRGQTLNEIA